MVEEPYGEARVDQTENNTDGEFEVNRSNARISYNYSPERWERLWTEITTHLRSIAI